MSELYTYGYYRPNQSGNGIWAVGPQNEDGTMKYAKESFEDAEKARERADELNQKILKKQSHP